MGDVVRVYILSDVGQMPGKRAEQQAGLFGILEVFPVDPQKVDGAAFLSRRFFVEQFVDKHPGIHGDAFHIHVIPLFHFFGHKGVHPSIDMGPSAVHVPVNPGPPGLFPDPVERGVGQSDAGCPCRWDKRMKEWHHHHQQKKCHIQSQGHKISFQVWYLMRETRNPGAFSQSTRQARSALMRKLSEISSVFTRHRVSVSNRGLVSAARV